MPHLLDKAAQPDTGLLCLVMLMRFLGEPSCIDQLRHQLGGEGNATGTDILRLAQAAGLKARLVRTSWERLAGTPLPAIAVHKDGRYFILVKADDEKALIQDPLEARPLSLPRAAVAPAWTGELILLTRRAGAGLTDTAFADTASAPGWLIPALAKSPPSLTGRLLALTLSGLAAVAIAWVGLGELEVTAAAPGRIGAPAGRDTVVQSLVAGIVRAVHVGEGQSVVAGELLIELDPTESVGDRERLAWDFMTVEVEAARLRAALGWIAAGRWGGPDEADFTPPAGAETGVITLQRELLRSQLGEFTARLAILDGQARQRRAEAAVVDVEIARLTATLPLIRERVAARRHLSAQGYAPRLQTLELEQERIEAEQALVAHQRRLDEITAALATLEDEKRRVGAEFRRLVTDALAEVERWVTRLRLELAKAERQERQRLTAPVNGVVRQLAVPAVGGVVTPGQPLLTVIPGDRPPVMAVAAEVKTAQRRLLNDLISPLIGPARAALPER